ncbi:uncharacterized protein LOC121383032 isoform X13 [Gigantopelta aegis]|uniref:uncharacterized protein LOC121383032 isoform X13 n=1 Tax=Gigantopelta aegis TaxID=1735272 RepID=UPI001B889550|nr:uncharacterized protein LOC121383032 isoform X13 [Gigantopelta aegis]
MLEKQYSVKFFSSFIEAIQKVCRDFLDYEQGVELSGYLAVEIDNIKKERYVLSEFIQSSGNVISESFCTKAFKTVPKSAQTPEHRVLKEHNTSSSIDLIDSYGQEQASINRRTYLPGGYSSNQRHSTGGFHSVRSTHSSRSQPQIQPRSSTSWISSPETVQSHQTNTSGRSSFPGTQTNIGFEASDRGFKRNATDLEGTPSIKIARSGSADHSIAGSSANLVSETHSNPEFTQSTQSGMEESVHLPLSAKVKQEEEDDDDDVTLIESISDFSKGDGAVGFGGDYSDILRDDVAGSSQNMYMQLSTSGEKVELFKNQRLKTYTETDFKEAMHSVLDRGISLRKAAKMFNVPHQTLWNHISGKHKRYRAEVPPPLFPKNQAFETTECPSPFFPGEPSIGDLKVHHHSFLVNQALKTTKDLPPFFPDEKSIGDH